LTAQIAKPKGEKHAVLQNAIRQIDVIKDHLPKAIGFRRASGGGPVALNRAQSPLQQAIEFDKK
jgi:hypothetical protein